MSTVINYDIGRDIEFFYTLEKIHKTITKFIGIIGLIALLLIFIPITLITVIIVVNINNKRRLSKLKIWFATLSPEQKTKEYIILKEFNNNLVTPVIRKKRFFIFKKIFKNYILLKEHIDNTFFLETPQKLFDSKNDEIIEQMQEDFADGWKDDNMNIYDFTYAQDEI